MSNKKCCLSSVVLLLGRVKIIDVNYIKKKRMTVIIIEVVSGKNGYKLIVFVESGVV